jgi:hypothetical protein
LNAKLDPTLIPALDAIESVLNRPRQLDKRQLLNSMQRLDYEMRLRHYPAVIEAEQERDAAEFFAAEQCPSDANF